jgi:hypothetical protein
MSLKDREPTSPAEWAALYRQDLKALRGKRSDLEARLTNVKKTIAQWEAVVAMERCPKGYRQLTVSVGGVPTDHDYWWNTRQRPQLAAELRDLQSLQIKIEKELSRLA